MTFEKPSSTIQISHSISVVGPTSWHVRHGRNRHRRRIGRTTRKHRNRFLECSPPSPMFCDATLAASLACSECPGIRLAWLAAMSIMNNESVMTPIMTRVMNIDGVGQTTGKRQEVAEDNSFYMPYTNIRLCTHVFTYACMLHMFQHIRTSNVIH